MAAPPVIVVLQQYHQTHLKTSLSISINFLWRHLITSCHISAGPPATCRHEFRRTTLDGPSTASSLTPRPGRKKFRPSAMLSRNEFGSSTLVKPYVTSSLPPATYPRWNSCLQLWLGRNKDCDADLKLTQMFSTRFGSQYSFKFC